MAECESAQPDESLADAHLEVSGGHTGGLVRYVVEVGARAAVTVTATLGLSAARAAITGQPAAVQQFELYPTTMPGGAASVPASLTVPAGATGAPFTVTTQCAHSNATVSTSATYDETTQPGTLAVTVARHQPVRRGSIFSRSVPAFDGLLARDRGRSSKRSHAAFTNAAI